MALEYLTEAFKTECKSPAEKLVLITLCNYADVNGCCYPSAQHIATICNLSRRSVVRVMNKLESDGVLQRQSRYSQGAKQISNMYRLNIYRMGKRVDLDETPLFSINENMTNDAPRGDTMSQVGVTPCHRGGDTMSHNTKEDTKEINTNVRVSPKESKQQDGYSEAFDKWWNTYPRRTGSKLRAHESWMKVCKKMDADILLRLTREYARLRKNEDPKFTPHPTTWLNQARYETVQEDLINRYEQKTTRSLNSLAG